MSRQAARIAFGSLLILLGAFFLAAQLVPAVAQFARAGWPLAVVLAGVAIFVIGLLTRVAGLATPAATVAGVGALLYYQNTTGDWQSWAYAWTLIPGFAGVGMALSGALGGRKRRGVRRGVSFIALSAVLFAVFASFLGGPVQLRQYWPVALILVGLGIIVRAALRR